MFVLLLLHSPQIKCLPLPIWFSRPRTLLLFLRSISFCLKGLAMSPLQTASYCVVHKKWQMRGDVWTTTAYRNCVFQNSLTRRTTVTHSVHKMTLRKNKSSMPRPLSVHTGNVIICKHCIWGAGSSSRRCAGSDVYISCSIMPTWTCSPVAWRLLASDPRTVIQTRCQCVTHVFFSLHIFS
jgi:hypothetical protein